jgi:amino acid adenylation domain-containing protein
MNATTEPGASQDRFTLSKAQRRIWYADKASGECGAYNIPMAWQIAGPLDEALLEQALQMLLQQHDALRTRLIDTSEVPKQYILAHADFALERLSVMDDAEAIYAAARREAQKPFQLTSELPIRASVLKIAPELSVFLMTVHHLVADGWSMGLLLRDLRTLYAALLHGAAPKLSVLPLRYVEYLAQLEQALEPGDGDGQAYWTSLLQEAPPLLLPTDFRRSDHLQSGADCHHFDLDAQLADGLRALAAAQRVTPFAILASCMQVQLHRYTEQSDVCLGYPAANRGQRRTQRLVGCFINTLVLRTQLKAQDRFSSLLQKVAADISAGRQHEGCDLLPLQGNSCVRVLLNLNPNDQPSWELDGVQVQTMRRVSTAAAFDMALIISDSAGAMRARLEYHTGLFDARTAAEFAVHYGNVLRAVLAEPDLKIGTLALLNQQQTQRLLVNWNGAPAADAARPDIYPLFEAQVQARPDAPAILGGSDPLSYAQLHRQADALAGQLTACGAGPERMIAVLLERARINIVVLLAILKTGAVYVPLDPAAPHARLADMLDEVAPTMLLTQRSQQHKLSTYTGALLLLDGPATATAPAPLPVRPTIHPQQLAYCIFTSGSTGKPKAVMVPYGALADHLRTCVGTYKVTAADRALQFASTSFDTSIEQMLVPLCAGAALLMRPEQVWSPIELTRELNEHAITIADIPMSYWHVYAGEGGAGIAAPSLRLLLAGGEPALAARCVVLENGVQALNAYGPTEATVTCALGALGGASFGSGPFVPIGRPLANTRIYILDAALQLVPAGVAGEIYIAGPRLARGYLARPELTAAQFIPDPFGAPGSRMYRTGDVGRHLPDGSIEFLGRNDQQVKVRGFRIELGEVEGAILQCPGVQQAAVCVERNDAGDNELVAFVAGDASTLSAQLRSHVRDLLPHYMTPSMLMFVDSLPLTRNGKVDRKALLAMPRRALESTMPLAQVDIDPDDKVLSGVLAIVAHIAGTDDVQLDEDLVVSRGFHSMQWVRMVAQCNAEFRCRLSVRDAVKARTVDNIANKIRPYYQPEQ